LHRPAQFGDCGVGILNRDERNSFDARRYAREFFVQPVVVRATGGDRPIFGDDSADGQTRCRVNCGPVDFRLIEKIDPLFRSDVACARAFVSAFEIMKVDMIERGENLGAISRRHVSRDLVHARTVINMTVGVDDLHNLFFFRGNLDGYNKRSS
jgi:hypothetical protein